MQFIKVNKRLVSAYGFCTAISFQNPARLNHVSIVPPQKTPDHLNLVVLHGLLGSSSNFQSIMKNKKISSIATSYLLDLRNHGASEHKDSMTLPEMAHDIYHFLIEQKLHSNVVLLAHSFGARVAMQFALQHPEILKGAIIVDMAPYNYSKDHRFGFTKITHKMLENLLAVDLKQDYKVIIQKIKEAAPNEEIVGLIITNLVSDGQGGYQWRINLKTIFESYLTIQKTVPEPTFKGKYKGPVKVICGEKSDYISSDILPYFHNIFENFNLLKDVSIFKEAGHWLHYQKPHEFITEVQNFLQNIQKGDSQ